MKKVKMVAALLIIAVLSLSFLASFPAFADGGSITVSNALPGNTYTVYKAFGATYSGTYINYTIDTVNGTDTNAAALVNAILTDTTCPFSILPGSTGVYWIQVKDSATVEQISTWLSAKTSLMPSVSQAAPQNSDELVFSNIEPGYYLVTSGTATTPGAVVTIDTATPNAVIIDKNVRTPLNVDKSTSEFAAEIGEEVPFTVSFYAVNFRVNDAKESKRIMKYTLTDENVNGLSFLEGGDNTVFGDVNGTISLYRTKTDNLSFTDKLNTDGTDFKEIEFTYDPNTHTLEIVWADGTGETAESRYPSNVYVVLTYKMKVNSDTYTNVGENQYRFVDAVNRIDAKMKLDGLDTPENIGEDTASVKTTGISVTKVDADVEEGEAPIELSGAEFILYKESAGKTLYWTWNSTANTVQWTESRDNAQKRTADNNELTAEFIGLELGTYYLLEVTPPEGYTLPANARKVEITKAGDTGLAAVVDDAEDAAVAVNANGIIDLAVTDVAGIEMPGTGGAGIKGYYTAGGILVAAAAALLIVKLVLGRKDYL